jgi:predicted dehydrogenase
MSGWVFHAPFIAINPAFELHGVWERTKNLASEKYPGVKTFRSLEELLADEAVELVVVNTPNATHFEYTKKALEASKHVVVEKPFTITVAEAQSLAELAVKRGRVLTVYQNRRFDSDFRTVRKVVEQGLLGQIVEAEIHYDRFKEEPGPKLHKETPGPGTGLLYDLGSHLIDQVLQLFGMPEAVFADIAIMRKLSKVDDYMEVLLYYPNLRVRVKSSYTVREATPSYAFHGTKGSFIKARTDVQETALQANKQPGGSDWGVEPESERGLLHTEKDGKIIREYIESEKGNYGDFYSLLFKSIREGDPLAVTPRQATDIIRIIEAAYESNRSRQVVAVK